MNVLHFTDLHINNPMGSNEAFRDGFYQEYLFELIANIKTQTPIDYIFITGDIVDCYKHQNFPHAEIVIDYIAKNLSLTKDKLFFANGNHDIPQDDGDITHFNNFVKKYQEKEDSSGSRYKIYCLEHNNIVLSLNSSGSNEKDAPPEKLGAELMDEIVRAVRDFNPNNIFVLSHHPAVSYAVQAQAMFDEEPTWSTAHLWADGGQLLNRLSNASVVNNKVFWFAGDIHRPELTLVEGKKVLVTTGSCSCIDYTVKTCSCEEEKDCRCLEDKRARRSQLNPQFRVVSFADEISSTLFDYRPEGHNNKGLSGHWKHESSEADLFNPRKESSKPDDIVSIADKTEQEESVALSLKDEVLDNKLQNEVKQHIKENNLYHFGIISKAEEEVPLSWIKITELFNDNSIYRKVISRIQKKINELISENYSKSDCILVGFDNWGSIISARLSAGLNIRSCSIAVKGNKDSYDDLEVINNELNKIVKRKKIVIILSDVINTGKTISKVLNELEIHENSKVINMSVFFDPNQTRSSDMSKIDDSYYICNSIKMPIVNPNILPSSDYINN